MKIITTHRGSDFDALASLVAAGVIYPDARLVLPGFVNANLKPFLAIHKDLLKLEDPRDIELDQVETLIVTDTHSWNRLDPNLLPLKEKGNLEIIVWDHHMAGDMGANWARIQKMGSTVTLVLQEIQKQKKRKKNRPDRRRARVSYRGKRFDAPGIYG